MTKQETATENKFDVVDFVIRYEGAEMDENEIIAGFQELINNGMAWTLQGHYGRTAMALIEEGYCTRKAI